MFQGVDHLAVVVPDTEEALRVWRDRFGFPVVLSETAGDNTVLLTHLDLGNVHLQLVEPLTSDHPLQGWLRANGPGLHHLCLAVDEVALALRQIGERGLPAAEPRPHQGTRGKRAVFLDRASTANVQVELTGR